MNCDDFPWEPPAGKGDRTNWHHVDKIVDMTKRKKRDARKFIADLLAGYNVSRERLINGLIELGDWFVMTAS